MTRIATTNYGASLSTQFEWATSDNDQFDRELDLYRLAQALENHTHESTRGLPVSRLATNSVLEPWYGDLSVSTRALANAAVSTGKIADGAVTDAKLASAKYPLAGGILQGNMQIVPTGSPTTGTVFLGSGGASLTYDGANIFLTHPLSGGPVYIAGDMRVYRTSANQTGQIYIGLSGAAIAYDGTTLTWLGYPIWHGNNSVPVPQDARVWFQTLAQLTAAGVKWVRDTVPDGRLLVGYGAAGGITPENFLENTFYGSTWAPLSYMEFSVTAGTLSVSGASAAADGTHVFLVAPGSGGGATNVSTADHTHTISGGTLSGAPGMTNATAHFLPPMFAAIWAKRV